MKYKAEDRTVVKGKDLDKHLLECLESFRKCEKCGYSYQLKNIQYKCDNGHYLKFINEKPKAYG